MYRTAALLLALALGVGACTGESASPDARDDATQQPTSSSTSTVRPSQTPSASTSATGPSSQSLPEGSTGEQSARPVGDPLVPTEVRFGRHDGYDRVVVELEGDGTPGYLARYVGADEAMRAGSGELVDLDGEAVLWVRVDGVTYPEPGAGSPAYGAVPAGGPIVRSVYWDGVFEGESLLFLGVAGGERPYRIFTLTEPRRLVIDVTAD